MSRDKTWLATIRHRSDAIARRFPRSRLREFRELPDQLVHDFHVSLNALVLFPNLLVTELVLWIEEHVRGGLYHGERSAQVVRHFRQLVSQIFRVFVHACPCDGRPAEVYGEAKVMLVPAQFQHNRENRLTWPLPRGEGTARYTTLGA